MRRRRRSIDETRELILSAATDLVTDGGIDVTIGKVDLLEISHRAGFATAGSAYKIWPTQEEFRVDLLRHVMAGTTPDRQAIDDVTAVIHAEPASLPPLPELIRIFAGDSIQGWAAGSATFSVYLALWVAADTDPDLLARLGEADTAILDALTQMYIAAMEAYGRELVPPYTAAMLAVTLSAVVEGLAVREYAAPGAEAMKNLPRATGPDGQILPWSLYACCVEAVVDSFTRPRTEPGTLDSATRSDR